jgi:hypothetical protein
MEEFLNEVRAHSFFPPKFPSIQRRPNGHFYVKCQKGDNSYK